MILEKEELAPLSSYIVLINMSLQEKEDFKTVTYAMPPTNYSSRIAQKTTIISIANTDRYFKHYAIFNIVLDILLQSYVII